MKLFSVFSLVVVGLFLGCGNKSNQSIVGNWGTKCSNHTIIEYTFKEDKTFEQKLN